MVPKQLRHEILKIPHDALTAGPLGFAKAYDGIRRKYNWLGLKRRLWRYVSHCREYQRRNSPPQLPCGQIHPLKTPDVPFSKIEIDLLGHCTLTGERNGWDIVCTYYLKRFTVTKASANDEGTKIAKFIVEEIILRHGAPKEMISFVLLYLVKTINQLFQTSYLLTTAYHTQTKRPNRKIKRNVGRHVVHVRRRKAKKLGYLSTLCYFRL